MEQSDTFILVILFILDILGIINSAVTGNSILIL